jgi:hypothetical protein
MLTLLTGCGTAGAVFGFTLQQQKASFLKTSVTLLIALLLGALASRAIRAAGRRVLRNLPANAEQCSKSDERAIKWLYAAAFGWLIAAPVLACVLMKSAVRWLFS